MFMSEIFLLFLGMQCFYVNEFALLNFWFRYIHWLVGFWEVQNEQRRASCSGTPLNNPAVKFSLLEAVVDGVKFCNYYFLPEITPLLWWWNPVLMMTGRCYTICTNLLLHVLQLAVVGMICLISFSCIENIPGLYMIRVWKRNFFWNSCLSATNWTMYIISEKIQSNVRLQSNWNVCFLYLDFHLLKLVILK